MQVIFKPILSEKMTALTDKQNRVAFVVSKAANKLEIKRAVEAGLVSNRGGFFYLREDGSPLCGNNEDPTFNIAAKFLASPKNQSIKFSLEAKLKE